MPFNACSQHGDRDAGFRCDGCGKLLCEECIEQGHRLLFCAVCGERALPLVDGGPATSKALTAERKRQVAYSWAQGFAYAFRGSGAYVFWSYPAIVVLLSVIAQLPLVGFVGGCAQLVLTLFVVLLVPGALFAIIRETADGDIELPEWPDFFDYANRFNELFEFLLVALLAVIAGGLTMRAGGCTDANGWTGLCWWILAGALAVAMLVWIPAFASVAVYRDFWLALRFDLHWRAVQSTWRDFSRVLALSVGTLLVGQVLAAALFVSLPVLGAGVSAAAGLYSWFTIAHFVGLWVRRNDGRLAEAYQRLPGTHR